MKQDQVWDIKFIHLGKFYYYFLGMKDVRKIQFMGGIQFSVKVENEKTD